MQLQKRNISLVILSMLVGMIIFGVILLLIISNTEHVIFDNNTGLLNCAGALVYGDSLYTGFSLQKAGTIRITASSHILPPSSFDIYIMTESQYNAYLDGNRGSNATCLHQWDLTRYYNKTKAEYYLDTNYPLQAGNYYLVVANNYYHLLRGVYGSASIKLGAYFSVF